MVTQIVILTIGIIQYKDNYEGPFAAANIFKPKLSVLKDTARELYSRNVPISRIKVIAKKKVIENEKHFEVLYVY